MQQQQFLKIRFALFIGNGIKYYEFEYTHLIFFTLYTPLDEVGLGGQRRTLWRPEAPVIILRATLDYIWQGLLIRLSRSDTQQKGKSGICSNWGRFADRSRRWDGCRNLPYEKRTLWTLQVGIVFGAGTGSWQ